MKTLNRVLCVILCFVMLAGMLSAPATAATTNVNQIELTMEAPALGKKPADTAIGESASSEFVSIEWYGELDDDGCFKANTVYSAKIVMKIKDQYTNRIFKTVEPKNLIINGTKCSNGQMSSEVSDDGRTVTLAYTLPHVFTESGSKKSINYINVVDVDVEVPQDGQFPATADQVTASDAQTYVKDVKWSGALDAQGRFIAGNEYTVEFLLGIKPGERLAFATAPWMYESHMTVNGKESQEAKAYYDCQQASVYYTFTALGDISSIPETDNVNLSITPPAAGQLPRYDAKMADGWSSYVCRAVWSGDFDEYGRFQAGEQYTITVTAKVDPTAGHFTFNRDGSHLINNEFARCKSISSDRKEITVSYTFPALTGAEVSAPGKTSVSAFQPGDYGTIDIPGNEIAYLYETTEEDAPIFKFKSGTTLLLLAAHVEGDWCAVFYEGNLVFMEDNPAFTNRVKYGSTPVEPYQNIWKPSSEAANSQPITVIKELAVTAKLGENPTVSDEYKKDDHMYYVSDFSWNCNGTLEPFMWAEVVITCKAKDGYYFAHNVKNDRYGAYSNVPHTLRYVDKNTVELTYYKWIDGSPADQGVTDAMKLYNELHTVADPFFYPTYGTAKLYAPIDDTTEISRSWRIYDYPSCTSIYRGDKMDETGVIKILDWDLSDEIPELTGDWCRISYARTTGYVPKSVLTDVELSDFWEGAPAEIKNTPFKFAGGSGTETDPFLIATAEQLNSVRLNLKGHYKLIADIDLSKWGNWVPIGGTPAFGAGTNSFNTAQYGGGAFMGSFDGNGHVISGMTLVVDREIPYMQGKSNDHYIGLFGITGQAIIKNLGIVNHKIDISYSAMTETTSIWAGAFSGWMNGANLVNCYSSGGSITINAQAAEGYDPNISIEVGGLAGQISGGPIPDYPIGKVERCYNASDVTVKCNKLFYLAGGGICATTTETWFTECFNTGNITLPTGDINTFWRESYAGGILAEVTPQGIKNNIGQPKENTCYIGNCYNAGNITANTVAGIYVFNNDKAACYVENSYNIGKLTCHPSALDGYSTPRKGDFLMPFTSCNNSTYIISCYTNGNGVSGSAWQKSTKLGRMVLKAIPEDALDIPDDGPANPFVDVSDKDYYFEPVLWAVEKNITTGTTATTFSPKQTCTRAQILTFLWRAVGSPKATGTNPFTDVKTSDYFYDAAIWAYNKGMVSGNKFAGTTPCTRIDTVIYLWKNAGAPEGIVYGSFLDLPAIPDAAEAVGWAVANAVTLGTSATTFSPYQTCTRGQIVTFLYRAIK